MLKKLLIAITFIIVITYGLVRLFNQATHFEWGHHFTFKNELGIEIDSLEITIGDVKNIVIANSDSLRSLADNLNVPTEGYPHKVRIHLFSKEEVIELMADSFNCFNCDGSHLFILKESGAEYKFLN